MSAQLGQFQLGNAQLGDGAAASSPAPPVPRGDDSLDVSSYWFFELPTATAIAVVVIDE